MDKKKLLKIIIISLLSAVLVFVILVGVYSVRLYNSFDVQQEETQPQAEQNAPQELLTQPEEEDEEEIVLSLSELRSADDLSTALREWSENTDDYVLMKSKKVINFLLIGGDEEQELADVIMIASVNKTTKQIFLTSIMRDSYTYIPIKNSDTYGKINAAYYYGGAEMLKSTIERDFKIEVDYYVTINYEMFVGLVDALGGVELEVQEYEARAVKDELRYVWQVKEDERECPWGERVTLNGYQALTFCRIRHCDVDADISRTRRQRQFITALIERSRQIKMSQIDELLEQFSPYIRTDCPKSELASLASQAILGKWYNYEIVSSSFPQEGERMDYSGNAWVWIVDYPLSAYHLQNMIYGESNIILSEDRVSVIDIMQYTGNTGTAMP